MPAKATEQAEAEETEARKPDTGAPEQTDVEETEAGRLEAEEDEDTEDPKAAGTTARKTAPRRPKTASARAGKRPADEDGERVRSIDWGVVTKVVVGLVLLASIVTAGVQWYQADQAAAREAERQQVRTRAGEFGQALLSYDHRDLQAARNKVLALSSDDFAKTYDVAFTGGLESVITRLKASATATVRNVYLEDIDEASARAIVVMDSEVRSTAGTRRVLGSHLDMKLTRSGDRWRVTEVNSIGAADETMTDPQGKQQGTQAPLPTPSSSPGD
jgi:Mce-associated membrane protein